MNILYINVIEQHAGWGAEFFLNRGFLNRGIKTTTLDYRKHRYNLSQQFLKMKNDFDVLFLQRGEGFPIELLDAVKCPRFFWASELVARNRDQDRLLQSGLFAHIFVHSSACKKEIINRGWASEEKLTVLLNGFDENTHYNMDIDKDIDVLFVGNILPRRRVWLDRLKKHFKVIEANVFGKEMTRLFNRAKIVLNIHAEEFPDTETRVFEALGCGTFLLSERLSDDSPFLSNIHLVEVDDWEQMAENIEFYLNNEDIRESIAKNGYEEALFNHTYTKRSEKISAVFSSHLSDDFPPIIDRKRVKSYARKEFFYRQLFNIDFSLITAMRRSPK